MNLLPARSRRANCACVAPNEAERRSRVEKCGVGVCGCPHQKETVMAAIESRREKFAAHHGKVSSSLLLLQLPLLLSLPMLLLLLWQPFKNLSGCALWLGACCMHMAHVATPTKSSGIRPQCVPPASFVCTNNNNKHKAEGKKKSI